MSNKIFDGATYYLCTHRWRTYRATMASLQDWAICQKIAFISCSLEAMQYVPLWFKLVLVNKSSHLILKHQEIHMELWRIFSASNFNSLEAPCKNPFGSSVNSGGSRILLRKGRQLPKSYYYRSQTKLREGNVFTRVCLFTWGALPPVDAPLTSGSHPHPPKDTRSTGAQYASY